MRPMENHQEREKGRRRTGRLKLLLSDKSPDDVDIAYLNHYIQLHAIDVSPACGRLFGHSRLIRL